MGTASLKADLATVLEEEIAVFADMLDLLTREQEALVRDDVEAIRSITERQAEKAREVSHIEARRLQVSRTLGQGLGLAGDPVTLGRICERCDGEDGRRLGALRDRLLGLIEEIRSTNGNNALLIRHALRYMDRTLSLLKDADGLSRVYGRSGVADGVAAGLKIAVNRVA